MRIREATRILMRHRFELVRQKGGHRQFRRGKRIVTVAGAHGGKEATRDVERFVRSLERMG